MGDRRAIATEAAPAAIGPYSQAIVHAGIVYLSGQIALDPATGALVEGDAAAQTERIMANLAAVLEAAGSSFAEVLRATIFLTDLGEFANVNAVYARSFEGMEPPARACVEVSRLPKDVAVEISMLAAVAP